VVERSDTTGNATHSIASQRDASIVLAGIPLGCGGICSAIPVVRLRLPPANGCEPSGFRVRQCKLRNFKTCASNLFVAMNNPDQSCGLDVLLMNSIADGDMLRLVFAY
jgi:hypothetical protein